MKISKAKPLSNFRLELTYQNGESGIVDLASYAGRGVFAAWNTPGVYESVQITADGAVAWPGDVDLCPDALYLRMTGKKADDIFPALAQRVQHA